ncbi:MAG: lysophospholipid acyltransferase family protein [Salinivirgaceae bacterium]
MKYLIAFFRFILLAFFTTFWWILGMICFYLSRNRLKTSERLVKQWAKTALKIISVKIDFSGKLPLVPVIIMANHRSYLDVMLILSMHPAAIVGKKELSRWPVIGQAVKVARMILVDRSNAQSLMHTMAQIGKEVKSGNSVIVFPEGTTYTGPLTGNFKGGTFAVAVQQQVPVLPCAIHFTDLNDAWIGADPFLFHFLRQMGKRKTQVKLWFGEPILVSDTRQLIDRVKNTIDQKLNDFAR